MNSEQTEKTFDHSKASVADKILLIGELLHCRNHALRSAVSVWREDDDSDSVKYLIIAKRAQILRREYMQKHFNELKETDWCLCKAAASVRQLAYEVCEGGSEELRELDDFVDEVWGLALGRDLSSCIACAEDRQSGQETPEES